MEKENKNKEKNIVIILLIIITLILATLLVLVVTGKLDLNKVLDNNDDSKVEEKTDGSKIYSADEYISLEDVTFDKGVSTKKVKFNHLDDSVTSQFYQDQQEIIDNVKIYSDEVFTGNAEYKLKYFLNNNILSVLYMIEVEGQMGKCTGTMAVTNIDLVNNKNITEEELLEKVGLTYKTLTEKLYDEELASWNALNQRIGSQNDYYEVTFDDFSTNKEKYVNIGLTKVPNIIYTYVEDGKIKYDYYTISKDTIFHQVGTGGCFNWDTTVLGDYK